MHWKALSLTLLLLAGCSSRQGIQTEAELRNQAAAGAQPFTGSVCHVEHSSCLLPQPIPIGSPCRCFGVTPMGQVDR